MSQIMSRTNGTKVPGCEGQGAKEPGSERAKERWAKE